MGVFGAGLWVVILTALPVGLWLWTRWLAHQPAETEDDSANYLYGWLAVAIFSLTIMALYSIKMFIFSIVNGG
jgi:hypothetical protein